ncbi:carbon-nitrogen family hydrolase [Paenibacillus yanchengensis]|uniref:Carbon-nitrogen family hydrolase n=1 Tax=Paenibacillus yanchengensis TaxID=2035833 RepID=A0ABW4YK13_9BACL
MASKLQVALLQMDVFIGDVERNYEQAAHLISQAKQEQPTIKVIILPELWNTGFQLDQIKQLADQDGHRTKQFLAQLSKQHDVYIVGGSVAELKEDQVLNTTYVYDPTGAQIANYSKVHLFRLMNEEKHLTPGNDTSLFSVEETTAGSIICYDTRFPELSRKLAISGAKMMFVPAQWPHPRLHHWRTLLMARAIENQMYVIACNRSGVSDNTHFFGHSLVIDPWGEVIAEASEEETILYAEIDLHLVDDVRAKIPVFQDRRPEIYKIEE